MRHDRLLSSRTHTVSGADVWDLVQTRAQRSADRIAFVWHPYQGHRGNGPTANWPQMQPDWPLASSAGVSDLARGS